jgi:iron complex outermembrane receptor protein
MAFRWIDEMELDGGGTLDSAMFSDVQVSYVPAMAKDSVTLTAGFNNVFDEDPPVCFPCGVIGLSTVAHDLPGRVGYVRLSYELKN